MNDPLSVVRTTFRVSDFLGWQRQGALNLRPPFQRGSVWNKKAKSFFIDTLVRGFPVPLIFLQDDTDPKTYEPRRIVVDGQQRLRTALAFIDPSCLDDRSDEDEFTVLRMHNERLHGRPFDALEETIQSRILQFQFSVATLAPGTPNRLLLEVFARMNSTGSQLKPQEIRNARFNGAFKRVAYSLSYDHLEQWLDWKVFTRSQVARMTDVEFTSELMMATLAGPSAKSQKRIDEFYESYDDEFAEAPQVAERIGRVLKRISDAYAGKLNREYGGEFRSSPFNGQGWLYAIFSAVDRSMHGAPLLSREPTSKRALTAKALRKALDTVQYRLREGDAPARVLMALRGAAGDLSSRVARQAFLEEAFEGVD